MKDTNIRNSASTRNSKVNNGRAEQQHLFHGLRKPGNRKKKKKIDNTTWEKLFK